MRITQNKNRDVTLTQKAYSERILEYFKMNHCALTSTPLPPGSLLSIDDCPTTSQETSEMAKTLYCEALELLMWLQVATCPDLTYTMNILFRFSHNPGRSYWNALKHTLAYVKETIDYEITYRGGGTLNPIGYVDSDYVGCKDTRRSTKGNVFIVAGRPVSWESKCQETVALSIVESEYMTFTRVIAQALWIMKFFTEIGLPVTNPITIYTDNNRSISNSTNDKNHHRTKHIDVKFHFVKEHMKKREIMFIYILSLDNLADLFTKSLSHEMIRKLATAMDLNPKVQVILVQREC